MKFSIISYNTLFNGGTKELPDILNQHQPDIFCLQEVLTEEKNLKKIEEFGYKLADAANSFVSFGRIYGVATYYNPKTLVFKKSATVNINTNISEYFFFILRILLGYNQPKVILKTDFTHKKTKKHLSVCNVHLYVIGSNEARVNHLNYALNSINFARNPFMIFCGDFNYFPYRRKKLEKTMLKHHLKEATKNIRQTMNIIREGILEKFTRFQRTFIPFFNRFVVKHIKTDYIFYRGFRLTKTEKIPNRHSDHYPILSTFSI